MSTDHRTESRVNNEILLHCKVLSDHPGLLLVTTTLTNSNFHAWSRATRTSLAARTKLGFINGKISKPDEESDDFEDWFTVDSLVIAWITNSISKDIVNNFLYANSARELWLDLIDRFGACNGPMVYQLKRDIANISQGNLSNTTYFTKIKRLWDELGQIKHVITCKCCSCEMKKKRDENNNLDRLVELLMD